MCQCMCSIFINYNCHRCHSTICLEDTKYRACLEDKNFVAMFSVNSTAHTTLLSLSCWFSRQIPKYGEYNHDAQGEATHCVEKAFHFISCLATRRCTTREVFCLAKECLMNWFTHLLLTKILLELSKVMLMTQGLWLFGWSQKAPCFGRFPSDAPCEYPKPSRFRDCGWLTRKNTERDSLLH